MFGAKLKELRKSKGYSMDNLIELYNKRFNGHLNKSTISRYENNLQIPMFTVVKNMAELFGVTTDYLINDENEGVPMDFDGTMERNNKTREPFSDFLQKKLKEYNLSIEQLSENSHIPYDTLVSYVKGEAFPNYEDFDDLSWILGFSEREMALYTDSQTFKYLIEGRYSPNGFFIRKDDTIAHYDVDLLKSNYNKLNELGKKKADEYIDDLVENPKYTKDN